MSVPALATAFPDELVHGDEGVAALATAVEANQVQALAKEVCADALATSVPHDQVPGQVQFVMFVVAALAIHDVSFPPAGGVGLQILLGGLPGFGGGSATVCFDFESLDGDAGHEQAQVCAEEVCVAALATSEVSVQDIVPMVARNVLNAHPDFFKPVVLQLLDSSFAQLLSSLPGTVNQLCTQSLSTWSGTFASGSKLCALEARVASLEAQVDLLMSGLMSDAVVVGVVMKFPRSFCVSLLPSLWLGMRMMRQQSWPVLFWMLRRRGKRRKIGRLPAGLAGRSKSSRSCLRKLKCVRVACMFLRAA